VSDDERQRVNLRCFAECDSDAVLVELKLAVPDLYPDSSRRGAARVLREFRYRDEKRVVRYLVRRFDRETNKFIPYRPEGDSWTSGMPDGPTLLYRLPELLNEPDLPVFWTEGERDADTLAKLAFVATTVHGSIDRVDLSPLKDRSDIFVVVDNDRAGWNRGHSVADHLAKSTNALIEIMRPPDEYKDVTAALAHGVPWSDLVDSVNLHLTEPPVETWVKPNRIERRPVMAANGHAIGERFPIGLFLQHHEQGTLTDIDVMIWIRMEDRSGKTGAAYLTASDIAQLQGVHRDTASASLRRLEKVGLIQKQRRGRWAVYNPAHEGRHGQIDLSGTFRNRLEMPACSTATPNTHSHVPRTSPGNAELEGHSS